MSVKFLRPLIAILLCAVTIPGQVKDAGKFSRLRVPRDLRERLAERFNLFVEYERTGQYEKQYDLLADEARRNVQRHEYAEGKRKAEQEVGRLLELKVTGVGRKLTDGKWVGVDLRPKLWLKGRTYSDQAISFTAYLQDGDWYFSMAYVEV